jgi:tetratricopeptide (TPR) repeat protein
LDFTKQIQKAEEAARRRNYDFAVQLYQQILEIDPDQGDARAGLRQSLKKRWDLKGGGSFLRTLSGAGPLALAKTLRKTGKRDACAKALESYLATNPVDEEANLMLGMVLEELGHTKSARAVYEFVTEVAPKSPEGFKRAGAMSARLGEGERALDYYEKALAIDPRDQEAIKARKDLSAERALKSSNAPEVQHSRDQLRNKSETQELERTQRMHFSDEDLRAQVARLEARFTEDKSPELMTQLSELHEKLKDYESALDWVERALSYRKDSFELASKAGDLRARVMKKQIAEAGKRGDEARASVLENELLKFEVEDQRRRVALRPADPALRLQLGKRLMRLGEWDSAMAELQKGSADPRAAREARVLLAQCFQGKGYTDLARKEYLRVLEGVTTLDERAKEVLYNLGVIAEAEGNAADARGYYSRIFETDVGYRDVAAKMERLK